MRLGEIDPWMKTAEPFIYARISSQEQSQDDADKPIMEQTIIKDQIAGIQRGLKETFGLKQAKKKNIFADLATGNDMDRPGFKAFMEAILNHKGRAFVALSEPSRWSRNITLGEEAFAPLYRRNIPKVIISDGTISHTAATPRPNEQALLSMRAIFAQAERGQLIQRVKTKISALKDQGILPAGIGSFYPFARRDPLEVILENISLVDVPQKQGGGKAALGRLVVSATAPNGPMSDQWWKKEYERHVERKAKLSAEEFEKYMAFRRKWRALQKERDFDSQKDGPIRSLERKDIDFGLKAAQRFANGYLRYPFDPQYRMPTEEELKMYLEQPKEFLSDKDKKLYRRLVSKR